MIQMREGFINFCSVNFVDVMRRKIQLYDLLQRLDIDRIKEIVKSHFTSIRGEWYRKNKIGKYEGYYSSVIYSYFASLGLQVRCEDATNHGRIGMTVVMEHVVFIIEFKTVEGSKDKGKAIRQIKEKNYAEKYKGLNLPIYLIGIDFDKTFNISMGESGNKTDLDGSELVSQLKT